MASKSCLIFQPVPKQPAEMINLPKLQSNSISGKLLVYFLILTVFYHMLIRRLRSFWTAFSMSVVSYADEAPVAVGIKCICSLKALLASQHFKIFVNLIFSKCERKQ